ALLGRPRLLVLDEPANGLDPEGIRWLREFLRSFAAGGGTVLISSHVLAEVAQLADEVVMIHRGRLVAQEPLGELSARTVGGAAVRTPATGRGAAQQPPGELPARTVGATVVRTPDAERLEAELRRAGIEASAVGDGELG